MTSERKDGERSDTWRHFLESYTRFRDSSRDLHASLRSFLDDPASTERLKAALQWGDANTRAAAIHAAERMKPEQRQQLFNDLLYLSSFEHGQIQYIRDLIRSLPRDWVLARIETEAEPLLAKDPANAYPRLLELYEQLDSALMLRLAQRAAAQADPDIRESGEDFLEKRT
jgi:hypothetical protein